MLGESSILPAFRNESSKMCRSWCHVPKGNSHRTSERRRPATCAPRQVERLLGGVDMGSSGTSGARRCCVAIVGPPPGFAGGMGTLMQHLALTESDRTTIEFLDSGVGSTPREEQSKVLRLWIFLTTCLYLARRRHHIDLVHINLATHGSTFRKVIFGALCRVIGLPYVVHLHGGNIVAYTAQLPALLRSVQQRFVGHARSVIALGQVWRPVLMELWSLSDDRIEVVYNAVPAPQRQVDEDVSDELVFVGRFETNKGAADLLEALLLIPAHAKARLTVIGSLTDESIKNQIAQVEQRTPHRIRVTGWLDQDGVKSESLGKGIFVLPSHFEGLPLALLDAMAVGQVPVVTPVGTVPEIITDGENGFFVPVGDPQQLAQVLTRLITDENIRSAVSRKARETWATRFDLSTFRRSLDDIWIREAQATVHANEPHPRRRRRNSESLPKPAC